MKDDYLWDGSGRPDSEVERLERLLGRFRHRQPAPELPLDFEPIRPSWLDALWIRFAPLPRFAAAATMALLVAAGVWMVTRQPKPLAPPRVETRPAMRSWEVARLEGAPKVGSDRISRTGRLPVGGWLETDAASRARIKVGQIGEVEVEPNTRLRLVETRSTDQRLALQRGAIHARIWAPPRVFFVETPSAVAVDLGCAYTLEVDDAGAGLVRVTYGWVGFERNGRESFIPEGALCATRPGVGPGTPYFKDASPALRAALARLDFEDYQTGAARQGRAAALRVVLAEARRRDGLTLWHLLSSVRQSERGQVYDRMAALIPPPRGVTREAVLQGDKHMLELWWDRLGLGQTSWWRLWERPWPKQD